MASLQKQKGSKFWNLVWWQDGRQRWKSTGITDRALAERALEELRAVLAGERREGKIRAILEAAGEMGVAQAGGALARLGEAYLAQPERRKVQAETLGAKRAKVAAWVVWMAAKHPEVRSLHEVSERMALEYMASLTGVAGGTRNSTLTDLRGVWEVVRIPLGLGNPWAGEIGRAHV